MTTGTFRQLSPRSPLCNLQPTLGDKVTVLTVKQDWAQVEVFMNTTYDVQYILQYVPIQYTFIYIVYYTAYMEATVTVCVGTYGTVSRYSMVMYIRTSLDCILYLVPTILYHAIHTVCVLLTCSCSRDFLIKYTVVS